MMLSYSNASCTTHIRKEHIRYMKGVYVSILLRLSFFILINLQIHANFLIRLSRPYLKTFISWIHKEMPWCLFYMLQTRADKMFCYIEINAASIMHELMIVYTSANVKSEEMKKCQHTFQMVNPFTKGTHFLSGQSQQRWINCFPSICVSFWYFVFIVLFDI